MRNPHFLLVGYSKAEYTQICHLLSAMGFHFVNLSVLSISDTKICLWETKADLIICHPRIFESINFTDLLKKDVIMLVINPLAVDVCTCRNNHNAGYIISNGFTNEKDTVIRYGSMVICPISHSVTVCGQQITLTHTEYDILLLLASNPKRVFTYEMITDIVWHENYSFYSKKVISNHVSNIKKKIRAITNDHQYIVSVHGIGYKFIPE